jgi:transposase, IS5 family
MSERKIGQMSFAEGLVVEAAGGNAVLDRIAAFLDWRPIERLLSGIRGGVMGAPGYPGLMMFKALLLQRWYALSDPALEEALKDRLSFRHFLGVGLSEPLPDHSSLWRFREALGPELGERIFAEIGRQIDAGGFVLKQGTLIDASLIPAAVNAPKKPDAPLPPDPDGRPASKLVRSELDPDAAWTKKEGRYLFGYKIHVAMDETSRIIRRVLLTPANVNESEAADQLICGDERTVLADKAFDSHARRAMLKDMGIANGIMRRGHPSRSLTPAEIRHNKRVSKRRGAIEPIFGQYKNVYDFARAWYYGLKRNTTAILLAAAAMNLKRVAMLRPG